MVKKLLLTVSIFLAIDFVWLGLIAKDFYTTQLSSFERTLDLPAALLVYLVIAIGIVLFVIPKSPSRPAQAGIWGSLYGLIVYGVYDLTNKATLRDWTMPMVVVDMLWGMIVCGLASLLVVRITKSNEK